MQKTLTKTIASILVCLSLALSSIGFLPMNVFAGTGSHGMITARTKTKVTGFEIFGYPDNKTINVKEDLVLTAGIFMPSDAHEDYKKVEWEVTGKDAGGNNMAAEDIKLTNITDTTAIISVSQPGQVTITATAKNGSTNQDDWKSASVDITVLQPVTDITIGNAPANNTMDVGKTCTLTATLSPTNVSNVYKKVEWTFTGIDANGDPMSDEKISLKGSTDTTATIGVAEPGTVTITATAKNGSTNQDDWKSASVNITVLQPVTGITGFEGLPAGSTMDVGKTYTLSAKFDPTNVSNVYKTVEWTFTDIDANGDPMPDEKISLTDNGDTTATISVSKPGTVTITATAKNGLGEDKSGEWIEKSVEITVLQPVTGITIGNAPANNTMDVGKTCMLTATLSPTNVSNVYKKVTWSSDKPSVATVDKDTGKVIAKLPGTAKITATAGDKEASVDITVLQPVTGIEIKDVPESYVDVGNEFTLTAKLSPENVSDTYKTVTWGSNNTDVAEVEATTGKVTAKAPGQVTITAKTANDLSATCKVYVDMVVVGSRNTPRGNFSSTDALVVGPVKLKFSVEYIGADGAWYPRYQYLNSSFKLTVIPANGSDIQIQKCVFRYRANSAEVTEEPFEHSGWYDGYDFPIIDQVDVYFTSNAIG